MKAQELLAAGSTYLVWVGVAFSLYIGLNLAFYTVQNLIGLTRFEKGVEVDFAYLNPVDLHRIAEQCTVDYRFLCIIQFIRVWKKGPEMAQNGPCEK